MYNKIPVHAEKVFSWVRIDVYQWDQELYDGSITRFERARFLDGAFCIGITPEKNIIITEQEQPARKEPFISLPGWAFDSPNEDPLDCAKRELFEETGYESDEWKLWMVSEGTQNIIVNTYFYVAQNCRLIHEHKNPDHGEKIQVFTYAFDEFVWLCEDPRFVHWTILPHLFSAKLHSEKYQELKEFLGV